MNLEFTDYKQVERDGVLYMLQRIDVTHNGRFWQSWRTPHVQVNLKKLIYIFFDNETGKFYACRLKPIDESKPFGEFNLSYQVKFPEKLLPYQSKPVSYLVQSLLDNGAAADGSDTGLGKTFQALATCRELSLKPLVVCRKAGIAGWKKACKFMNIEPYLIVNWEILRTSRVTKNEKPVVTRKKREFRAGYDYTWHVPGGVLLIFDEAHLGFNVDSQNYALWTASAGRASLSLSATFADRPVRLKGLFKVLRIMTEEEFDKWLMERGHFVNQYNEIEGLTDLSDMKAINKLLYPKYGYRVSYDDVEVKAFFPERVIQTEIVDLGDETVIEQNKAYEEMIKKAQHFKTLGQQAQLLVADMRYRQYAELLKVKVLAEMVQEYVYEGMAVAVFVNFRETLRYLAEILKTKSLIFGDQERYNLPREDVIENFQSGLEKMILCMIDAGGQSISLHDLEGKNRRMSLICPTYNPVALQQVLGRTLRAGSKSTPIMKLIYAAGTVEEKVAETVNRKLDNIAALNDGDLMEPDLFRLGV
jgi:superfamily II DNA or RNA helicase